MSKGKKKGEKLHIPQLPKLRNAFSASFFFFFEALITHPAAKQHSSTHADKGKSLLQSQIHHNARGRLN